MSPESKAIRKFETMFPSPTVSLTLLRNSRHQRQSSRGSLTRTRRMYGRWVSGARESRLLALIPASFGRITHSSLTIAAGTESLPITITTGMTPSTTALVILAVTIRLSLAMIMAMALIPSALQLATTAWAIKLEWRPERGGLVAVTWTRATGPRPDTLSAWNGSWRLIPSVAGRATRLEL